MNTRTIGKWTATGRGVSANVGGGFIGEATLQHLLRDGVEISVLIRDTRGNTRADSEQAAASNALDLAEVLVLRGEIDL